MLSAMIASCGAFLVPHSSAPSPVPGLAARRASAARMATGNDAVSFPDLDGTEVRVGILRTRWHDEIVSDLVSGVRTSLTEAKVQESNIIQYDVPGAFELPLACRYLALSGTVDAIVPIGVLIKGETTHFEVISDSVTSGLMQVGLSTGIPVVFGVLTAMTEEQAVARSTGTNNHGLQWGKAAVDMATLRKTALGLSGASKSFMGFGTPDSGLPSKPPPKKIGF